MRILKSLYDRVRIVGRNLEELTDRVDITEDALQREILSAILFVLHISNFEEYFWKL